jgi:hypothetical protein
VRIITHWALDEKRASRERRLLTSGWSRASRTSGATTATGCPGIRRPPEDPSDGWSSRSLAGCLGFAVARLHLLWDGPR